MISNIKAPVPNSFVIVKFAGKKKFRYYIGHILQICNDNTFEVKFLRRGKNEYFIFPNVDDIANVEVDDIDTVLADPEIDKRGHHIFSSLPKKYKLNLC